MFRVMLDTCVLFKPLLCDTVLSIAEEGVYHPLWSSDVLEELRRNLARYGVPETAIDHRVEQMTEHFPGSLVAEYETLIPSMSNDPKDRHVLAAAVRGGEELIVTENLSDFTATATKPYDIDVVNQDDFLMDQLDLAPAAVRRALARQVSRYRRSPRTVEDLLMALGTARIGCPTFARTCYGDGLADRQR